nr:MAG: replication associated protein [Cressdnaviricota sp.]
MNSESEESEEMAPSGAGEGNTKPLPRASKRVKTEAKKRISPSKYWCFTLNNYTEKNFEEMAPIFHVGGRYVYGKEVGEQGTPHLQGWICFTTKQRPLEFMGAAWNKIHWEKSDIKREAAAIKYCLKEGGEYRTNIENIIAYLPIEDPMKGLVRYDWQVKMDNMLTTKPDDRKIYWLWDSIGNTGKTSWASSLIGKRQDAIYVCGKAADVKFGIVKSKFPVHIVIWDLSRSQEMYVSYQGMEEVKNGIFFSCKYEASMHRQNKPHVIVFANFAPDRSKLSPDRWVVEEINTHTSHVGQAFLTEGPSGPV